VVKRWFKVLSVILVLLMTLSMTVLAVPNSNALTAFDQKVLARVDAIKALEHIKYLTEEIGPRVAGTKEEKHI